MLVDGPVEWAETAIPVGNKLDLLQHAYNARLGVAALPRDSTVALVQFSSENTGDEVIEAATDEILLHSEAQAEDTTPEAFRFIAWSTSWPAHLAIATVGRAEVWRVSLDKSLQAVRVGSFRKHRIRGISWHPVNERLLVYSDLSMDLIEVTADGHLDVQPLLPEEDVGRDKTKLCAWSPCGLVLARSSESCIRLYAWSSASEISTQAPSVSLYRVDAQSSAAVLGSEAKHGSIISIVLLSPSVIVVVTDTPLALADVKSADSTSAPPIMSSTQAISSNPPSSNVIDLTSLRITATSKASLLNILDRPKISMPVPKRNSHLAIVAKNPLGQWHRYAEVPLDQLAIPDVFHVEAMRVVVGSTISNRLVVLHLDHNLKTGWSASVSGELDLPDGHVCRGVRLAKTSPFVQVASTEKVKKTFFHVTSGPQRIQLSKFKVPLRRRETERKPSIETPSVAAPPTVDPQATAASHDVMATLLSRMEALQTLIVTRFDHVEKRLDGIAGRLDRLEVRQKPSL